MKNSNFKRKNEVKETNFQEHLLYRGGVIRYSTNSSVVPYFSGNLPLYVLNTHFHKNSVNPVPYRHPFSEMRIFTDFPKIITFFPF